MTEARDLLLASSPIPKGSFYRFRGAGRDLAVGADLFFSAECHNPVMYFGKALNPSRRMLD
jgi:hypothetical protein